jgi:hypothetical protein
MKPQTRPFKAGTQEKLFPERGHDAYNLQRHCQIDGDRLGLAQTYRYTY